LGRAGRKGLPSFCIWQRLIRLLRETQALLDFQEPGFDGGQPLAKQVVADFGVLELRLGALGETVKCPEQFGLVVP
jgi:hypothetical protein